MALSFIQVTANGSTTNFSAPNYIDQSYIHVDVNGVDHAFTWAGANTVVVSPAPANGAVVKVYRLTPRDVLLAQQQNGLVDDATVQILADKQALHLAQEVQDGLDVEELARADADDNISANLLAEVNDRINAVTAEANARIAADAAEATARINAVNAEASTRATAVTNLATNLSNEVTDRISQNASQEAEIQYLLSGGLGDPAYTINSGVIARSNSSRWGSKVYAEEYGGGIDPTGGVRAAHTAINNAILDGIARGKYDIMLPTNPMYLPNSGGMIQIPATGHKIRLIGGAKQGSRIRKGGGTGTWLKIGDETTYTEPNRVLDVEIIDTLFEATDPMTSDEVILARFCNGLKLSNVTIKGVRTALTLGGGTVANDAVYIFLEDCAFAGNGSGQPVIKLSSGGTLHIYGGSRHNGVNNGGSPAYNQRGLDKFIQQMNTSANWDGLYVDCQIMEDWSKYVEVIGKGISNLEWRGKQIDGAVIAFDSTNMSAGGGCANWNVYGVQFLFCDYGMNYGPHSGSPASRSEHVWMHLRVHQEHAHHMLRDR
jgi:hypothetical protein